MVITELKKRSDIHWARKIWHLSTVSVMAVFYDHFPESISLTLLFILAALFIPFDILRQRSEAINNLVVHLFKPIMRTHEVNKPSGSSYLIAGVVIVVLIFPPPIVLFSLYFLAFGDPAASYFGIRFGRHKLIGNKSLQGFLSAFMVCTLITYIVMISKDLMTDQIWVVSIICGLIGALSELIPIGGLDDNLTLPVLSATGLWLTFWIFDSYLS